jgi:hypothetical protein
MLGEGKPGGGRVSSDCLPIVHRCTQCHFTRVSIAFYHTSYHPELSFYLSHRVFLTSSLT